MESMLGCSLKGWIEDVCKMNLEKIDNEGQLCLEKRGSNCHSDAALRNRSKMSWPQHQVRVLCLQATCVPKRGGSGAQSLTYGPFLERTESFKKRTQNAIISLLKLMSLHVTRTRRPFLLK